MTTEEDARYGAKCRALMEHIGKDPVEWAVGEATPKSAAQPIAVLVAQVLLSFYFYMRSVLDDPVPPREQVEHFRNVEPRVKQARETAQ